MEFTEPGFRVTVPASRAFRLSECETFVRNKGDSLHEYDVIFQNDGDPTLWLVEFKDYREFAREDVPLDHLMENLRDKTQDTLYVLASVWSETDFGVALRDDIEETFPHFPDHATSIRPIMVLSIPEGSEALMGELNTMIRHDGDLLSTMGVMDITHLLAITPGHGFIRDKLGISVEII